MTQNNKDIVYGRRPVLEAIHSGLVAKVLLAKGTKGSSVDEIIKSARQKKIPFHWVDRKKVDSLASGSNQGVVAYVQSASFADFDQLLDQSLQSDFSGPRLLFLDSITDPHNVGAILRTAVFFGVPGVVIPKWRSASLTGSVMRASAGAAGLIPVAQVSNLATAIEKAKKAGLWLVGADMVGTSVQEADIAKPFALVMGSEGEGLHSLIRKKCDYLVSIRGNQTRKGIDSLNVSVACGILLQTLV